VPTREVRIKPRGPFNWNSLLDMLGSWQPVAHFPHRDGVVTVAFGLDRSFAPAGAQLQIEGDALVGRVSDGADVDAAERQVARMFSLDVDATDYPLVGRRDPAIGRIMRAHPGLRPVLFPSPYEAAVWAVISQRIAQRQAARVKAELSESHGDLVSVNGEAVRTLPSPRALLRIGATPGLSAEKIERLHAVARAAIDGVLDAEPLRAMGHEAALRRLQEIRGIGPFWSSGIYLRACGVTEPFPADEPRTVRALADAHGLRDVPTGADLERIVARFKPFGMWVSVLLRVAANRGTMGELDVSPAPRVRLARLSPTRLPRREPQP
jgi:DNA-3-methyladenine glycosylase II